MTQSERGLRVYRPNTKTGIFASFAYLKDRVPPPFEQEWSGGAGQVIHHKFVVTDFNAANPIVFTGSSNLAAGGEHQNGDNLLMIRDRDIATVFAVEGLRLVDHYHFRAAMKGATRADPLLLKQDADRWWAPYFNSGSARFRDRTLFVG
jgi:phosphatidylserine/phosphatidylglycerophosphate/cardiolipin synthase-like enzyme